MGLDVNGTQLLLHASGLGVDYTRTAMIGRQGLYLSPAELRRNLIMFGVPIDSAELAAIFEEKRPFAEGFLRKLGAVDIHSFDAADHEGCTHVHDMNLPIPADLAGQYSVVLDGGSLEHVFNFPIAIANCMEMVRPGGHFLAITPANNFMGHGFYQFSPELFFAVLSPTNGFQLERVIAFEDLPGSAWYSVVDPAAVGARVTVINPRPVYLGVVARRIEAVKPFSRGIPQQSGYVATWASDAERRPESDAAAPTAQPKRVHWARRMLVRWTSRRLRSALKRWLQPAFSRKWFRRMRAREVYGQLPGSR